MLPNLGITRYPMGIVEYRVSLGSKCQVGGNNEKFGNVKNRAVNMHGLPQLILATGAHCWLKNKIIRSSSHSYLLRAQYPFSYRRPSLGLTRSDKIDRGRLIWGLKLIWFEWPKNPKCLTYDLKSARLEIDWESNGPLQNHWLEIDLIEIT